MGVEVARTFPAAREMLRSRVRRRRLRHARARQDGVDEELRETRVSQPAIFTANVAIYRAVETLGFTPLVSAGHSFGEYCSLTIADSLSFDACGALVNERGIAMGAAADLAPGSMAAIIGFEQSKVEDSLRASARRKAGARVDVANLNAPLQIVVSGDVAGVDAVCEIARRQPARSASSCSTSPAHGTAR